jgi:endogenous inhibitor of DNA gyrase (YacG/DUF329 family)
MSQVNCPNCGRELPAELGQHAVTPVSGLVTCPHCGQEVHIPGPEATGRSEEQAGEAAPSSQGAVTPAAAAVTGRSEGEGETFSGHETADDLEQELENKESNT